MPNDLVPVRFHDDTLMAVRDGDTVWVAFRRVCDCLGLAMQTQLDKLRSRSWATVTQRVMVAEDGKERELVVIDLRTLTYWLATVDENRVAEHVRPKLVRYQAECADVLRDHFFGPKTTGDALLDSIQMIHQAVGAIAETRRRQLELERAQAETRQLAERASRTAAVALACAESNHGHFSVMGYARRTGRELTVAQAQCHGRELSRMCRTRGLTIGEVADPRFGRVNTYPESLLVEYFEDDAPEPAGALS